MTGPRIIHRPAQAFVAVEDRVPMTGLGAAIDRGLAAVFGLLSARGIAPAAAPIVRYVEVEMAAGLLVQLCVPVVEETEIASPMVCGVLPAGDYVCLRYQGPYDGLLEATAEVLAWGESHDVRWAMDGTRWQARLEHYLTDPRQEPDPAQWVTEVAILIEA